MKQNNLYPAQTGHSVLRSSTSYNMHMNILSISRYLSAALLLLLGYGSAIAQNVPALANTAPAGTATAVAVPPQITVPNNLHNYQRSFVPKVPMTDAATITPTSSPSDVQITTVYKDGFNRPVQSQVHNFTAGKNMVALSDNRFQQDAYNYLPYPVSGTGFRTAAFQEQRDYYTALYPGESGISYSYSHNASDVGARKVNSFAPGKSQAGQGRATSVTQGTNVANEVRIWTLDGSGLPIASGYYAPAQLFVETARAPNESTSGLPLQPMAVTYTDKEGRTVFKKVADSSYSDGFNQLYTFTGTYYVYDDMAHLRYILPPKAVELIGTSTTVSTTILNNLCFQYQYDNKGRVMATRKPGEGDFTYVVYDYKERPVMRQSPLEKQQGKWEVTYYDGQGRVKAISLYSSSLSQSALQTAMDNGTMASVLPALAAYIATVSGEALNPPETGIAGNEMMSYTWYDNYSIVDPNSNLWNDYAGILQFSELLNTPGAETPQRSLRIQGMVTGSKVKILPSANANPVTLGEWSTSVIYYDDKGRSIYTASFDQYQSNAPVHKHYTGTQYDFAGRVLATKHILINNNSIDGTSQHTEWGKNDYDNLTGRLLTSWHRADGGAWAALASYTYDDLGRVQRKVLGSGGEVQDFTYNIRGQLTGINGDFAETGNKAGLSKSFGESIKYDYGFTKPRYDGKISGIVWRGSTADPVNGTIPNSMSHAYGYTYDLSGRLKVADYRLWYPSGGQVWSKVTTDYTVSNLYYDKNGNILNMKQRGVKPGVGPVDMDNLSYKYMDAEASNRLGYVNDAGVVDYGASDFQNGNTGTNDYGYDVSGNLTSDLNKGITAVTYTHFNKPLLVTMNGSKSIQYSYDAGGNKIQEIVKEPGKADKVTDYLGNFIYENNKVQYILTGEGRTVLDNQTAQPVKEEYFVKDHLGNVRSVVDVIAYGMAQYLATYEVASANLEGLLFENVDEIREDKPGSTDPNDLKSGRLNGSDPERRIGTSLLVKVMAGDKVNLHVNNYYDGYNRDGDQPVVLEDMLSNIIGTLTGGVGGFEGSESGNEALVGRLFTPENFTQLDNIINATEDPSKPQAYLNYVLFDENMRLVKEMSGAYQANGNGSWEAIGSPASMTIPANGYLAVYLSNKTAVSNCYTCGDVFFDQLDVQISKGNLLEETHYYPHGLPIYGMGSAAAGFKANRRKYQSNEYIKDINLNWMDFHARQYDPQIGRFLGVDPLADGQGQEIWSPYSAMGNAPESMVDPNGTDASYSGTEAVGMFVSLQNATRDFVFVGGQAVTASEYGQAALTSAMVAVGGCAAVETAVSAQQSSILARTLGSLQSEVESSWRWFEFNKSDLEAIVAAKTGFTGGKLQNEAGAVFEKAFHAFMTKMHDVGYINNTKPFPSSVDGRSSVVPDGISDAKVILDSQIPFTLPGASWYEAKAARGTISKSSYGNQAWGLVTALEASNPLGALKGWLSLTFVTTHNMSISSGFINDAKSMYNINITQMKSMYRYNNGHFQVTFYDPAKVNQNIIKYFSPARPSVALY